MTEIGYIAANEKLAEIAETVFRKHGFDIVVEIGSMEAGVQKAQKLMDNGGKVLIARAWTALNIRKKLDIPVIEVQTTIEDIAKAVIEAKKLGERIAVVGFNDLLGGLETLNPLLNMELKQLYIENEEDILPKTTQAKNEGIDVIVGGARQCEFAQKLQLKSVLVESGPQAIYRAYKEAEIVLHTLLSERQRNEEIRMTLTYARDGYVAIDKHGRITLINPAAAKFMGCHPDMTMGKSLKDVCKGLSNLEDILSTGKEYLHDIISLDTATVLYNRRPIMLDQKIVGAVATLQDINVVQEAESKIRRKIYTHGLYARYTLDDIEGTSDIINKSKKFAHRFAKTDSTVLITGESGTGKEMFAQGIHNASKRNKGPFVAVNCASLPENILESELFGYVEGAFTGARKQGKIGLFEMAHDGTIFLDEISELPLSLQGRLLRVLQEKMVMRLGDDKVIPVDVRVIVATNKELINLIHEGKFREDLFFRINILRLSLPSLAERGQDISVMAQRFLREYSDTLKFSEEALQVLKEYPWPGNVRELRNLVERLSIITNSTMIGPEFIEEFLQENKPLFKINGIPPKITYEEVQRVLHSLGNNKSKAAEILGIHRSTLWRILKREGME